jgi:hypothetical protein
MLNSASIISLNSNNPLFWKSSANHLYIFSLKDEVIALLALELAESQYLSFKKQVSYLCLPAAQLFQIYGKI